jgi:glycoprotein-N-acetylgalactosamine 3-beta-galactosyltransferase
VNLTWAQDCDGYIFLTKISDKTYNKPHFDNGFLPVMEPSNVDVDAYQNLTTKVFNGFIDVHGVFNGYDWYLKADDDTFVFVENLRDFLKDKTSSLPTSFGYDIMHAGNNLKNTYHSGGAGYVLSKEALRRLVTKLKANRSDCANKGREDVDVSSCLKKVGVKPVATVDREGRQRFHHSTFERHYWPQRLPFIVRTRSRYPLYEVSFDQTDKQSILAYPILSKD